VSADVESRSADSRRGFVRNLRYAARALRRQPGFTAGVVLTLGLGIGANATMFGIVDRLLLRPPAYLAEPDAVHRVYFIQTIRGEERATSRTSYRRYLDLVRATASFSTLAAELSFTVAVGTGDETRETTVQLVSASFWRLFHATPAIGRFFGPDEDALPAGMPVAVLSYDYWRTRFGSRRDVTGQRIRIGTRDFTVLGVAPRGFAGVSLEEPAAFIPFTAGTGETGGTPSVDLATGYGWAWLDVFARRKPGVSVPAATVDLTHAYQLSYESEREVRPWLAPASVARPHALAGPVLRERGPLEGDDAKVATWLSGMAALVLLIACANVGNLLLARAFGRRREIAIRLALGVSHAKLVGQLLTESVLLAILGGALGLMIAQGGGGVLRAVLVPSADWSGALADRRVLAFAAVVALGAGVVTGVAPALQAGRVDLTAALRVGVRGGTYLRSRMRTALVVVQIALSAVLLVGAGLFVRSLHNARALPLGYDPARVLYVRLEMRGESLPPSAAGSLINRLLERARSLPPVEAAARTLNVPFTRVMTKDLFVDGIDSVSRLGPFDLQAVSPGYFQTMGTRVVRGRPITEEDGAGAPPVMLVSRSMARALWPGQDALGRCVRVFRDSAPCRVVVGVTEDIRVRSLRGDRDRTYYLPVEQVDPGGGGLFVRARGQASSIAEPVRRELQVLMPGRSYLTVTPLAEILEPQLQSLELGATMFTVFGVLALVVAAIGLYSVVAYDVAQRTHELGVRRALGAQASDMMLLVLREAVRLALVAVAIGIIAALLAGRWVASLLFETSAADPVVIGGVVVLLLLISAAAAAIPALRAARADPNMALRAE